MSLEHQIIVGKLGLALIRRGFIKARHLRNNPLCDDVLTLRLLSSRADCDSLDAAAMAHARKRISDQLLEWTERGDHKALSEFSELLKTLQKRRKKLTPLQAQTISEICLILEGKKPWPDTHAELRQRVDGEMIGDADGGAFSKLLDELEIKPILSDRSLDNLLRWLNK